MGEISREIGHRIRNFRKSRHMTLDALSEAVNKNKSTLSKYENGEIILDIETIYEIARALGIHVEQLLYCTPDRMPIRSSDARPAFFNGVSHFYSYYYDGRFNCIMRCVFDVLLQSEDNRYKVMMYVNFRDYSSYQNCETTYWGYIEHFDSITNLVMANQDSPMEKAYGQILANYVNSDTKWGMFTGLSARPMMPVAIKMLFSKKRLTEDETLAQMLKVTKEDIRLMKLYNMMTVM